MTGGENGQGGLLRGIADWACEPRLAFAPEALHQARLCFVDTLACMAAGSGEPLVRRTGDALRRGGSAGAVATVLGGAGLAAPAAALVNGAAAHALDFDDYEIPASTHPSAVIVPALLAVSDLRTVSLGDLLSAYLVSYETVVTLGRALGGYAHYAAGWHATWTVGPIAAAAATARLIALPPDRFAGALALAASSAAGLKRQFGSDAKPLHAGLAARSGLEAALLAEAGIGGNPDLMEGRFGFIACYSGGGAAQPPARPPSRGACAMHSDPVLRKPWPCCAYTHRAIEAALRLAPAIGVDTIAAGTIRIPEPFFRVAPFIEPQDPSQARFSLLYCVCAALADGALSTASFTADAVGRPGVRALMRRFEISAYDPGDELEDMSPAHPDSVCLRLRDGREVRETVAQVKGGPAHPLSDAEILRKFTDCGAPEGLAQRLLSGTTETALRFSDEQWTA